MSAINPKKINLVAVDGMKSEDELVRILLHNLKKSGIPVDLTPEERIVYGLDQPDAT